MVFLLYKSTTYILSNNLGGFKRLEIIFEHVPYEGKKGPEPGSGTPLFSAGTRQVLYLKKGEELFMRVSMDISETDKKFTSEAEILPAAEKFYSLLSSLSMLPNSLTLLSAGRELKKFYACFTLPVDDSMESIFEAIRKTTSIHRSEANAGGSLSVTFWKDRKRNNTYQDSLVKVPDKARANIRILL